MLICIYLAHFAVVLCLLFIFIIMAYCAFSVGAGQHGNRHILLTDSDHRSTVHDAKINSAKPSRQSYLSDIYFK